MTPADFARAITPYQHRKGVKVGSENFKYNFQASRDGLPAFRLSFPFFLLFFCAFGWSIVRVFLLLFYGHNQAAGRRVAFKPVQARGAWYFILCTIVLLCALRFRLWNNNPTTSDLS